MKDEFKRRMIADKKANRGPGGWACPCCSPMNGKRGARRAARRAMKVSLAKDGG